VYTLLMILFVLICFFLILVVLLQQGKGADVSAAFGGASNPQSFGPRGTTTLMHKLTTVSFVVFVVLCLGLSVLTGREGRSVTSGVKTRPALATPAPAAPAAPAQSNPPAAPAQSLPAPAEQPVPGK